MNKDILDKINQAKSIIREGGDESLVELAKQELSEIVTHQVNSDSINNGDAILEIRAGSGGDEAELFAGELLRMYDRYAQNHHLKMEIVEYNSSDLKGLKSLTALIKGFGAYGQLRFEGGVHRVQRVPKTEKNGRIHTSAASVVVLPEVKDLDVNINPTDLRIDVYRSSGKGGQGVNTTDSAVRITHIPTNIVVTCQDERSQLKNKAKAMQVLRSRLWDVQQSKQQGEIGDMRKDMIKSGDRSDKIRTYNFPQNRITDHRINKSYFGVESMMNGVIDEIVKDLVQANINLLIEEL